MNYLGLFFLGSGNCSAYQSCVSPHDLSDLEIKKINDHAVRREYAGDQFMFSEGDEVDSF